MLCCSLPVFRGGAKGNRAANALIGAWYPRRMRGIMVGLFYSGLPFGMCPAIAVTCHVAYHYGWMVCFGRILCGKRSL